MFNREQLIQEVFYQPLSSCKQYAREVAELWFQELGNRWLHNANIDLDELGRSYSSQEYPNIPFTYIALHQKKLIGIVSLRKQIARDPILAAREPWANLTPWLSGLVIHPNYRKCRLGQQLVEETKNQAKLLGFKKIYLFTIVDSTAQWYAKLGWEVIGTDHLLDHKATIMSIAV